MSLYITQPGMGLSSYRDTFIITDTEIKDYSLTHNILLNSEQVSLGGLLLSPGNDYTITGNVITLTRTININDILQIIYH